MKFGLLVVFILSVLTGAGKVDITTNVPHPNPDEYHCISHKAPSTMSHVVHFQPKAANYVNMAVHHMIVFGCKTPFKSTGTWRCDENPVCGDGGDEFLMYAWAKKAPGLKMPKDSGFVVGGDSKIQYFVVQQHFMMPAPHGLPKPTGISMIYKSGLPKKYAGIFILAVDSFRVPGEKKKVNVSTKCKFNAKQTIDLIAYRTHAHDIGKLVTGRQNNKVIVRHSPQIPQSFNEFKSSISVKPGDKMDVMCTYDSSKRKRTTNVGSTHLDEMCNLYYMFLAEEPALASFSCGGEDRRWTDFDSTIELLNVPKEKALLQSQTHDDFVEDDDVFTDQN